MASSWKLLLFLILVFNLVITISATPNPAASGESYLSPHHDKNSLALKPPVPWNCDLFSSSMVNNSAWQEGYIFDESDNAPLSALLRVFEFSRFLRAYLVLSHYDPSTTASSIQETIKDLHMIIFTVAILCAVSGIDLIKNIFEDDEERIAADSLCSKLGCTLIAFALYEIPRFYPVLYSCSKWAKPFRFGTVLCCFIVFVELVREFNAFFREELERVVEEAELERAIEEEEEGALVFGGDVFW